MENFVAENRQIERIISQYSPPEKARDSADFRSSQHWQREILIPLRGSSFYMLNDSVYELRPGMAALIGRFVPHAFGYTKADHDLLHLWISFGNRARHGFVCKVSEQGKYEIVESIHFPSGLMQLLSQRWDQFSEQKNLTEATVMDFMQLPVELIINEFYIMSRYAGKAEKPEKNLSGLLKNYIRHNSGRDCTMEKLSAVFGYSASHLAHVFRHDTGISIGDFINLAREEYTHQALENGMTQKEISYELGFSSAASFWNWLRKHRNLLKNPSEADSESAKKQD